MIKVNCAHCNKEIIRKKISKSGLYFCDRECKSLEQRIGGKLELDHYKKNIIITNKIRSIESWIELKWDGSTNNGSLSNIVRNFLLKESNFSCCKCGWNKKNIITGKAILTINHIDGNPSNHNFGNLEVLCYNCHSITENFGALNKGFGRGSVGIKR